MSLGQTLQLWRNIEIRADVSLSVLMAGLDSGALVERPSEYTCSRNNGETLPDTPVDGRPHEQTQDNTTLAEDPCRTCDSPGQSAYLLSHARELTRCSESSDTPQ